MNWSDRMNSALEYIENNLDGALSIADVADVACCSKYHFHRVFFASFKITLAEYIRRRKLTLAAVDVLNKHRKIVDIALKYGYESPNAFTRAFRTMHGVTPSKARSGSVTFSSQNQVRFPAEHRDVEMIKHKIIEKPAFTVIGQSKRFKFEQFVKEGPKFWKAYVGSDDYKKLYELGNGRPGAVTRAPLLTAYIPTENGNRDEFVDVLGLEAQPELDRKGFEIHSVPSATYAEFNCTYKTSMKTNRYIYGDWFASTSYIRAADKPDIVSYFPIPFRPLNEMHVRWWIPVNDKG